MNILKRMLTTLIVLTFSGVTFANAHPPLKLDVYQADEKSFFVSSSIISGEKEAILIDAQFTKADAHNVVAKILKSGKKLTTVYISHGDPDYYFGLEIIKQAFPEVNIYATAKTLIHIKKTVQKKLDFWGPKLGNNGPSRIIMPEVIKGDTLYVDGQALKIIGLNDHPERTYVWIPSLKAVLGGVSVFGNIHLWMADAATKEKREKWQVILREIKSLQPEIVVPGHATQGTPYDLKSVKFSLAYLKQYEAAFSKAKDAKSLINTMNKKFPMAGLPISLQIGAKVSTGEMTW